MAKSVQYKCDQCGTIKTESNGWFMAHREVIAGIPSLVIQQFAEGSDGKHYCGASCVLTVASAELKELSS